MYLIWAVGENFGGNINWLPAGSTIFGIPDEIQKTFGVDLLLQNGDSGWDGQFHYYMSNDLLGLKGYDQFVDNPPYRWQRIGLPLAAKLISLLHFGTVVSVYDYLIANLIILGIGIFVFAEYFRENNRSVLWVIPWCLSSGVLITLKSLLPDSAADALVVFAIIMLLKRHYVSYVAAMSLACLTREGYAAIALFVFLSGFFGCLEKEKKYSIKFAALLSIPGIVFASWYLYVTVKFGALPFTRATHITKFFMTQWPKEFIDAIMKNNNEEFVGLIFYLLTIIVSIVLTYVVGQNDRKYLIFLPYILVVGSFGHTVMKHWSGYLKGISFLFAIIPVLFLQLDIIKERKKSNAVSFLKICIYGYIIFEILLTMVSTPNHLYHMIDRYYLRTAQSEPKDYSNSNPLQDFTGEIEIKDIAVKPFASNALIAAFTPEYAVYTVEVKNDTDQIWSKIRPYGNRCAINMGYKWFDENDNEVLEGRTNLINSIQPFSTELEKVLVRYPSKAGRYILKISMVQEGIAWFFDRGGAYTELVVDVK